MNDTVGIQRECKKSTIDEKKAFDIHIKKLPLNPDETALMQETLKQYANQAMVKNSKVTSKNDFSGVEAYAFNGKNGDRCMAIVADVNGTMAVEGKEDVSACDFRIKNGDKFSGRLAIVKSGDVEMQVSLFSPKKDESLSYVDVYVGEERIDTAFHRGGHEEGKADIIDVLRYVEGGKRGIGTGCSFKGPAQDMFKYLLKSDDVKRYDEIKQKEEAVRKALEQKKLNIEKAIDIFSIKKKTGGRI